MKLSPYSPNLSLKAFIRNILGSVALVLIFSIPAGAQGKWELSIIPGVNVPTNKFGGSELGTGFGAEARLGYQLTNFLSAYTGWGWNRFNAEESLAGPDVDYEETGYLFGLQFNYPTTVTKITYVVSIGGLYEHIEAENAAGQIIGNTDFSLGTQIGAGVSITLGRNFKIIPSVTYKALSTDFKLDNETTPVNLKYLTANAGLSYTF